MPPTAIRRARKSLCERRLAASQRDLDYNLDRVELKAYEAGKRQRASERRKHGIVLTPIPVDVKKGVVDEELYGIECRLHREAGLGMPRRPYNLGGDSGNGEGGASAAAVKRIGFVSFSQIMQQVKAMYLRSTHLQ